MCDCFYLHCYARGRDPVDSIVFMHSPSTLLDHEPPTRPVTCDWSICVDHDVMWIAVGFDKQFCTSALTLPAGHSQQCMPSFLTAETCSRAWTRLDIFPSPLLAWALRDSTPASLIVLLGPSTTCLLLVYTPSLLWQHCRVDSWDSTSHWDMLWLASPYVESLMYQRETSGVFTCSISGNNLSGVLTG